MKLEIYYPHKKYFVTQDWGEPNPAYAKAFNIPEWTAHNGIDSITSMQDWQGKLVTEFPIYCPVENFRVLKVEWQPKGGGNCITLISKEPLEMFERTCHAYLTLAHAKKVLVKAGDEPALGELLMISDSTGFSTGNHLHMGLYRCEYDGSHITKWVNDGNNTKGSFDPALFFTKQHAVDRAKMSTLFKSGLRYYSYLMLG